MKSVVTFADFRGGWNADSTPETIADNELALADNVDILPRGGFEKRRGAARMNATTYGAPVKQILSFPPGAPFLLAIVGTVVKRIDLSTWAASDPTTGPASAASTPVGWTVGGDGAIYVVDGSTYRVAGTDGSFAAVVADTAADNDLTPVKECKLLAFHQPSQRYFAAGRTTAPSAVYFSEPGKPGYFKNTSVLQAGGSRVTAILPVADALLIFCEDAVWSFKGVNPATDATWYRLPLPAGTKGPRGACLTPDSFTFLGGGSVFAANPAMIGYQAVLQPGEGLARDLAKNRVSSVIRSIAKPEWVVTLYEPRSGRLYLAYTDNSAAFANDKILVLDWSMQCWTRYTGLTIHDLVLGPSGEVFAGTDDGYILKLDAAIDDPAAPVDMHVKTRSFDFGTPLNPKVITREWVLAKQYAAEKSSIDVTLTMPTMQIVLDPIATDVSFGWGDTWGLTWGWQDVFRKQYQQHFKTHNVQVELRNNHTGEPATVYAIAFEVKPTRIGGA